jgi:hypothetical protein
MIVNIASELTRKGELERKKPNFFLPTRGIEPLTSFLLL